MMNDSQLIDKAKAICGCLSYDDITPNGSPKAVIAELCHRLGSRAVRIQRVPRGYRMTNLYGLGRRLGWSESVMWWLFRLPPRGVVVLREDSK